MLIEITRPWHLPPLQIREGELVTWLLDTGSMQKFCRVTQYKTADYECSGSVTIGIYSPELDVPEKEHFMERERRHEAFTINRLRKAMEPQRVRNRFFISDSPRHSSDQQVASLERIPSRSPNSPANLKLDYAHAGGSQGILKFSGKRLVLSCLNRKSTKAALCHRMFD